MNSMLEIRCPISQTLVRVIDTCGDFYCPACAQELSESVDHV